jgi:hypothetical protein
MSLEPILAPCLWQAPKEQTTQRHVDATFHSLSHFFAAPGSEEGKRLGDIFDATYVNRVSEKTAGLYDGIEQLLRSLALSGHPQVGAA